MREKLLEWACDASSQWDLPAGGRDQAEKLRSAVGRGLCIPPSSVTKSHVSATWPPTGVFVDAPETEVLAGLADDRPWRSSPATVSSSSTVHRLRHVRLAVAERPAPRYGPSKEAEPRPRQRP